MVANTIFLAVGLSRKKCEKDSLEIKKGSKRAGHNNENQFGVAMDPGKIYEQEVTRKQIGQAGVRVLTPTPHPSEPLYFKEEHFIHSNHVR